MLRTTHPLYFPKLIYKGSVPMRQWEKTNKVADCYELDWVKKEEIAKRRHEEWVAKYHKDQELPYIPSLPEEYDRWLTGLQFVVSRAYVDEIRRNARRAVDEWNVSRPFDTSVREYCLSPAIKHVFVSFYLIADCTYDRDEGFYYRGPRKVLIAHAMAHKFWMHQTGVGCVERNAEFDRLYNLCVKKSVSPTEREEIEHFLKACSEEKLMYNQPTISGVKEEFS